MEGIIRRCTSSDENGIFGMYKVKEGRIDQAFEKGNIQGISLNPWIGGL